MRTLLENNDALDFNFISGVFGFQRQILLVNELLSVHGPLKHFFDPVGGNRNLTLPPLKGGVEFFIAHVGAANALVVRDVLNVTVTTLAPGDSAYIVCSGVEWRALRASSSGVDPATIDHDLLLNMVASKHIDHNAVSISAGAGLSGGGTIAANRSLALNITGLPTTAIAAADEFAFYDISGVVHGKLTLTALAASIDHDGLLNFVANKHIDHSTVSINPGVGMSGGGTIAASRTLNVDVNSLTTAAEALAAGDLFPFYDLSLTAHRKVAFSTLNGALDHNALANYTVNSHLSDGVRGDVTISGGGSTLTIAKVAISLTAVAGTNIVTATATPSLTAYVVGVYIITFANAPTGAVTLNVGALGALALLTPGGAAIVTGDYEAGVPYLLYCNGTNFRFLASF